MGNKIVHPFEGKGLAHSILMSAVRMCALHPRNLLVFILEIFWFQRSFDERERSHKAHYGL